MRQSYPGFALLLLFLPFIGSCSDLQVDQRDELGMEGDERYELVMMGEPEEGAGGGLAAGDTTLAEPVYFDPNGGFSVQVGIYSDRSKATAAVEALAGDGYPAYSVPGNDDNTIRVRIGYFKSRSDADRFGRIFVEDRGGEFWVDLRANEGH